MQQTANWWTEPLWKEIVGESGELTPLERAERRVRYHLAHYEAFGQYYCPSIMQLNSDNVGVPQCLVMSAAWMEAICIKADLDRAMKMLSRGQRRAIVLCLLAGGGFSYREAARLMRCHHSVVGRLCARGVKQIAGILAGQGDKNADSRQGM